MSILVEPSAESLEPSDSELISQVRAGDQHAQEMLYARHYDVALRVAYRHSNSPAEAEDLVATGFEKVFSILQTDNGPEAFFRAYLCTTVSRLAFAYNNHEKRQTLTDDFSVFERGTEHADPVMNQFESGVVGEAFRSLPERWQAVLWYTEIDGLKPAEVAPMLGLSPNGVSALAVRAREGLRQAYLQGHIKVSTGDQCQAFSRQLGAYVRGGLSARNEAKVDEHLADCNKCTAILLQINDVSSSMRGIIAPLFLGGITALGIPSAVTSGAALSISLGKATHAGTGTSLGTAPATGATAGTTTTFAGVGSSSLFGGIGAFAGANALAIAVTGVALAAVVAVAAVGGAELGNKSKPKQADGEITNGLVAPKQEIAVPGTQPMPGITDQDTLFFDEAVVSSPTATSSLGTAELPPDTDTVQDSKSSGVSTVPKGLAPVQIPPAGINSLVPQQPVDSGIPALPAPTDDHVPSQAPQISETPAVGSNPAQKPEASVSGQPSETVKPTSPVNPSESSSAPASPSTETSAVPTVTPTDPTVEPTEPTVDPTEPTVEPTVDPTEPTEPTVDPTEPTEPTVDPTEPTVDPTEPTEPTVDPTEPTEPTVDPTEPTEPTVDPTEPTEPTVDPTEPTEPTVDPTVDPTTEPTPPIDIEHGDTSSTITIDTSSFGFINLLRAEFEKRSGPGSSDVTVSSRAWCSSDGSLTTPAVFNCLQLGNGKFTFDVKKTDLEAIEPTTIHVKISGFGGPAISKDFIIE